jgi:glutaredoxin 3
MEVIIYSTSTCPFCVKAKEWMAEKQIEYTEISLDSSEARKQFVVDHPTLKTVPQIFVKNGSEWNHIGGYTDLIAKEQEFLSLLGR